MKTGHIFELHLLNNIYLYSWFLLSVFSLDTVCTAQNVVSERPRGTVQIHVM